jgi:hypothetical protein
MSDEDIETGARWAEAIGSNLSDSNYGIVVVTKDNQQKPWLLFEAGALSKAIKEARVVPLLADLAPADLFSRCRNFSTAELSRKTFTVSLRA